MSVYSQTESEWLPIVYLCKILTFEHSSVHNLLYVPIGAFESNLLKLVPNIKYLNMLKNRLTPYDYFKLTSTFFNLKVFK